jgi:hypothetical protein
MKKAIIYALIDPRTDKVRYIGCTAWPKERFRQHINDAKNGLDKSKKAKWILEMLSFGIEPKMVKLDEVESEQRFYWEDYYAKQYPKEDLLNSEEIRPHIIYKRK